MGPNDGAPNHGFTRAPRAMGIVAGVLFIPLGLLFGIVGVSLLESVWKEPGLAAFSVAIGSLCAACFTLGVSWRLLSGRARRDGGLLSPRALRASAWLLIAIPIAALLTGSIQEIDEPVWLIVIHVVGYLLAARGLFRLASRRQDSLRPPL